MPKILILYYSTNGSCEAMANLISRGVSSVNNAQPICRTVPQLKPINDPQYQAMPKQGYPYATLKDLEQADGLCLGCPTYFGNMPAAMKAFWDQTTSLWFNGSLVNKPAGLFTSASSLHGGHESTLLSMMLPLLHHGMLITGIPYTEKALATTTSGGTPYGASHMAGNESRAPITEAEKQLCIALGKRIANLATLTTST